MANIEKFKSINDVHLSREFYFQSLLQEALKMKLLSDEDIEQIQFQCLELLANKTERYNGGDSSSIRVEVAESIMQSNLYTIGVYLKSLPNADLAVEELKTVKILDMYQKGRKRVDRKILSAKQFFMLVKNNVIDTKNHTYNDTLRKGIGIFFRTYNPDYEAHETPASIDYQLCNPISDLAGIEYIQKYIESLYLENKFCKNFSSENINYLLGGYDKNYQDLLINIFEQVLTTALGCILTGNETCSLNVQKKQASQLYQTLEKKSKKEISRIVFEANKMLETQIDINSIPLKNYIEKSLPAIIVNINNAIDNDTLDKVFIEQKRPEMKQMVHFSFGDKMDNEHYRIIINDLLQCNSLTEKIEIIKENIHSLSDLDDLFFDAELTYNEILTILGDLKMEEIAALIKRHPFESEVEAIELSESEKELRLCLHDYTTKLPISNQERIIKIMSQLQDE